MGALPDRLGLRSHFHASSAAGGGEDKLPAQSVLTVLQSAPCKSFGLSRCSQKKNCRNPAAVVDPPLVKGQGLVKILDLAACGGPRKGERTQR